MPTGRQVEQPQQPQQPGERVVARQAILEVQEFSEKRLPVHSKSANSTQLSQPQIEATRAIVRTSSKGVMFIIIETRQAWRTDPVAGLVRAASGLGAVGWDDRLPRAVQREGEVIHVGTDRLEDLSDFLPPIGEPDEAFPIMQGRDDGATYPERLKTD